MKEKKFIAIALVLMLSVITLLASACAPKDDNVVEAALSYYETTKLPDLDNNLWTQAIEQELGFKIAYRFKLTNTMYETRLNSEIASGNIPDMFWANINQMPTLLRANLVYDDLTEIYDKYATPLTKSVMGWDDTLKQNSPNFKPAVSGGKLKAIPWVDSVTDSATVMYIRADWLKEVGREVPKTLAELEDVLRAFKTRYPSSKGLAANEDIIYSNAGSLNSIFNAYGAYPHSWIEKENGEIDFGYLQPEMKKGLELLRRWWSEDLLYKTFYNTKMQTIANLVAAGEIGVWMGVMSLPLFNTNASVANESINAEWIAAPVPSLNAETPVLSEVTSFATRYHVVRRGYNHPERLIQMINLFVEKMWGDEADFEKYNDIAAVFPFQTWPHDKNLQAYRKVTNALNNDRQLDWFNSFESVPPKQYDGEGDAPLYYTLSSEQKFYYAKVADYIKNGINADASNWAYARVFYAYEDARGFPTTLGFTGFDSSQSVIDYYVENNLLMYDKYTFFDTPTMSLYRRTIESDVSIAMKEIIRGNKPVSYFDEVVNRLKAGKAGKIVEEVNSLYKA